MESKLIFYGGVGSVTGANFMLDTGKSKILVDCGLMQGDRFAEAANAEPFAYDPAAVDTLVVTHAHADHIGRIPKLVREGFAGKIYSTAATKALVSLMFRDAYKVMLFEEERYGTPRLYEEGDIDATLELWHVTVYHEPIDLPDGVQLELSDAGHILGSAMAHFTRDEKKIVFTGDVGNVPQPLLNPPEAPKEYEYLVMESVYGDRSHEQVDERTMLLRNYIEEARARGGTLIIPAFSLERTQGILLAINNMIEHGGMEPLPVFLDSPLAIKVTEVYRKFTPYLKDAVQEQIKGGDDIFAFEGLSFTRSVEDSRDIKKEPGAKIIIAGSGMSHGGRIMEHEQTFLEDPRTILLLVGYQSVGSLGRRLQDGVGKVKIYDKEVQVRAKIAQIRGFSGHADREQLTELVAQGGDNAKQIFVCMGEEKSSLHLVQRLREYLGAPAVMPTEGASIRIAF